MGRLTVPELVANLGREYGFRSPSKWLGDETQRAFQVGSQSPPRFRRHSYSYLDLKNGVTVHFSGDRRNRVGDLYAERLVSAWPHIAWTVSTLAKLVAKAHDIDFGEFNIFEVGGEMRVSESSGYKRLYKKVERPYSFEPIGKAIEAVRQASSWTDTLVENSRKAEELDQALLGRSTKLRLVD